MARPRRAAPIVTASAAEDPREAARSASLDEATATERIAGRAVAAPRSILRRLVLAVAVLGVLLVLAAAVSASLGPFNIALDDVAGVFLSRIGIDVGSPTRTEQLVVEQLRLPRIVVGALVGMGLGVAGTTMQALFRNPMADPGIIGVSSGAALGAVIALAFGFSVVIPYGVPVFAFTGAIATAFLVYGIALTGGRFSMATLLLAGVAVSAFLGAMISAIILTVPSDQDLRGILFWLAGGLAGSSWDHVGMSVVPVALGVTLIGVFARDLNLLMMGDEVAQSTGVPVERLRVLLLATAAIVTGAAVAVSGTIAFVGLVVPHILRLIVGPDHRVLLPASGLAGALFIVVADTIARMAFQPAELQVGMVTAFVGAPFFVVLLIRNQRNVRSF